MIEAGADITLIPSRIEPSGLSAMYSLKYGALPVARATGGIQEIIEDYDPTTDSGYGFLYYDPSAEAFWDAIKRAREIFRGGPGAIRGGLVSSAWYVLLSSFAILRARRTPCAGPGRLPGGDWADVWPG